MKIYGETEGLRKTILTELEALYGLTIPPDALWTEALILKIADLSAEINREIALYLQRNGQILNVSIGDQATVSLPEVEGKRNSRRLTGIRCIHTHPNGSGLLSSADLSALKLLQLDAMIAVGVLNGIPRELYVGILTGKNPEDVEISGPYPPADTEFEHLLQQISETDKILRSKAPMNKFETERALLVGLYPLASDREGIEEADVSLLELEELTKTAGAVVVGQLIQRRETRHSSTMIGKGKLLELRRLAQDTLADLVIFDEELTATQQRNIEEQLGVNVLTRTGLILDIFALRARSREGILQVELAQMEYRLPRLIGVGQTLSRLGGGIGTRGPGETKLETDRRAIRRRIAYLKQQLADIRRQREVLRRHRKKNGIPVVAIVGYTNAGKSTLLNTLCGADVLAEDMLFATLDTTTRKLDLNNGSSVLVTDTVGFIRRLPPNLLDAFKSTLEEVVLSDLILIVADASDPQAENHVQIVDQTLNELGAGLKPAIIVLNKMDKLQQHNSHNPMRLLHEDRQTVQVSAKEGTGLEHLKQVIENTLFGNQVHVELAIPFSDGALISWLHTHGKVLELEYDHSSALIKVELEKKLLGRIEPYIQGWNN